MFIAGARAQDAATLSPSGLASAAPQHPAAAFFSVTGLVGFHSAVTHQKLFGGSQAAGQSVVWLLYPQGSVIFFSCDGPGATKILWIFCGFEPLPAFIHHALVPT